MESVYPYSSSILEFLFIIHFIVHNMINLLLFPLLEHQRVSLLFAFKDDRKNKTKTSKHESQNFLDPGLRKPWS